MDRRSLKLVIGKIHFLILARPRVALVRKCNCDNLNKSELNINYHFAGEEQRTEYECSAQGIAVSEFEIVTVKSLVSV